ncbi:MAG TPA: hypothetical protein ENN64_00950, partial [bacterium]|nr:hypothetical protein [bacterium]
VTNGRKGTLCGASTISQQLTRGTLMFDAFGRDAYDRSTPINAAKRKLREMLMTLQVERTMNKDELLEMYMNEVNTGGVNYGFEAGSQSIFGKSVEDLSLAESALIAGILPGPSRYHPVIGSQPEMAKVRQLYVLDQIEKNLPMLEKHFDIDLTVEDIEAAREEELVYSPAKINIKAPHFVFYVRSQLVDMYDLETVERGGLRVYTTLDYESQRIAEKTLRDGVKSRGNPKGVRNGALIALTPNNGEIVAMVGSVDYWKTSDPRIDGNVNVTTSERQMGSSFKPYTYLTAFHLGYSPGLAAPDLEVFDFGYNARNWDRRFNGLMTARKALVRSRNIPALYTGQLVTNEEILKTTDKLGITTLTDRKNYGLSLSLGSGGQTLLEHANAYGVFSNEGEYVKANAIIKIEDSKGNVLYEKGKAEKERVFDKKEVYLLNWTLCDLGGFGDMIAQHNYRSGGRSISCGKTGTTNGPRDLLAVAYHKNLVVAVWTGNNNNKETPGASSALIPLPIATGYIKDPKILKKYPSKLFSRPAGIVSGSVCIDTGLAADSDTDCTKERTVFIEGKAPPKDPREKVKVCKENNLIPTNLDSAEKYGGLLKTKTYLNITFPNSKQDSAFKSYLAKNHGYIYEMPESGYCPLPLGPENSPIIELTSPSNGSSHNAGDTINISASAFAEMSVKQVEFRFNNNLISANTSAPYSIDYKIPADTTQGTHTISATVIDSQDRSTTDSISISVINPSSVLKLSLSASNTNPSSGEQVVLTTLITGTDASSVSSVIFQISGPDGYFTTITDSNGANGWSVDWIAPAKKGEYKVVSYASGFFTESNTVSITVK